MSVFFFFFFSLDYTGLLNFVAPRRCRAGKTVASRATNLIGEQQQKNLLTANLPLRQKSCPWGNMMF
jgi:hypothetical protein